MSWFQVNKKGLASILERKGKSSILFELLSNAWDTETARVEIELTPIEGKPFAQLRVEDWGEGFADLSDAYTMFAFSRRAGNAEKRGRFSLGEKLVLSVCRWAEITTGCGQIVFNEDGSVKRRTNVTRPKGTNFAAEIRMTREEYDQACEDIKRVITPTGVVTKFNGEILIRPPLLHSFLTKLPTIFWDDEGVPHNTQRQTEVLVFEDDTGPGEILEMGIPVVETDNGYRVSISQKVPLSMDRDNVPPSFLRALQVSLLNNMSGDLDEETVSKPWVQEAAGDARAKQEAVKTVITKQFGENAVISTPSSPLSNAAANAAGYSVIPGGALSAGVWNNIKKGDILLPSSRVFPTSKPEILANQNANLCSACGRPM